MSRARNVNPLGQNYITHSTIYSNDTGSLTVFVVTGRVIVNIPCLLERMNTNAKRLHS